MLWSVRPSAWNNSAPTGRTLMKRDIWAFFFRKSVQKIQIALKSEKNDGNFTWRRFHIYDSVSLNSSKMRNVLDKSCRENQNTHFMFNDFFFENRVIYGIMSKNMVDSGGGTNDVTIWRMRVAFWISEATCTHAYARARAHTQTCNIYYFSSATDDSPTRLSVTLYVHCLYCYL
jgi:hypothetical protein